MVYIWVNGKKRLGLCSENFLLTRKSRKKFAGISLQHWEYMLFIHGMNKYIDRANINYMPTTRIKIIECKLEISKIFFKWNRGILKLLSLSYRKIFLLWYKIKNDRTNVCLDFIWTSLILYFLTFIKLLFIPEGLVLVLPSSQVLPEKKKSHHVISTLKPVFTSHSFSLFLLLTPSFSPPSSNFSLCLPFFLPFFPPFFFIFSPCDHSFSLFLHFSSFFALLLFLSPSFSSLILHLLQSKELFLLLFFFFFLFLIPPPPYIFLIFHTFFHFLSLPLSLALPFLPHLFFSSLFYFILNTRYLSSFCPSSSCFLFITLEM